MTPLQLDVAEREVEAARTRTLGVGDPYGVAEEYAQLQAELAGETERRARARRLQSLDLEDVEEFLFHPELATRQEVVTALEGQVGPSHRALLARALEVEADEELAGRVLALLASLEGEDVLDAVAKCWTRPWSSLRRQAVEVLCGLEAPEESLTPFLEEGDLAIRARIAGALFESSPARARGLLDDLFQGTAEDPEALRLLFQRLPSDRFPEVYERAFEKTTGDAEGVVLEAYLRCRDSATLNRCIDWMRDPSRPKAFRFRLMQSLRGLEAEVEDREILRKIEAGCALFLDAWMKEDRRLEAEAREKAQAQLETEAEEETPAESSWNEGDSELDPDASDEEQARISGAEQMREQVKKWVRVSGRVLDSSNRKPIQRATVRLSSSGRQEITDRKGQFFMDRLLRGEVYTFVVEKQGYPSRSVRYRVGGQKDQRVQILLVGSRVS